MSSFLAASSITLPYFSLVWMGILCPRDSRLSAWYVTTCLLSDWILPRIFYKMQTTDLINRNTVIVVVSVVIVDPDIQVQNISTQGFYEIPNLFSQSNLRIFWMFVTLLSLMLIDSELWNQSDYSVRNTICVWFIVRANITIVPIVFSS